MTDFGKDFNPAVDVRILNSGTDGNKGISEKLAEFKMAYVYKTYTFMRLWCFGLIFFILKRLNHTCL